MPCDTLDQQDEGNDDDGQTGCIEEKFKESGGKCVHGDGGFFVVVEALLSGFTLLLQDFLEFIDFLG